VEKPIDVTPAKIKALEDVVNKTGVKCGCIFQTRLNNCVRMLKKAIDRGDMGKVIGVHAHLPWFRAQSYYSGPHGSWKGTWELDGGGSLMNQGVHTLDLAVHLGGPVKRVAGLFGVFNHDIEAEDQAVAILEYENGALGTFYSTTCCHPDGTQHIFMYGSEGAFSMKGKLQSYDMGPQEERERMMALFSENPEADRLGSDPMAVSSDGHTLIVQDLVEAVRDDREPIIPIRDAKETVEVAYAIYESGRRGEFVNLSDVRE
jgi:predicted dehydrogenase